MAKYGGFGGSFALIPFRAAGDLVASICRYGNYLDWYCESPPATVTPEIAEGMAKEGWCWRVDAF